MHRKWTVPAVLAVLVVGVAMAPRPVAGDSFLSKLTAGMNVSVTQADGQLASIYVPSAAEAEGGGFFQVTEVGSDYVQCKSGSAVWRIPASSIGRIFWNE